MGKNKLIRFAEMESFSNTYQFPEKIAGTWHHDIFKNTHPITLELACGRGEYTVGLSRLFPERNFIGIDIKGSRLWRGAKTCMEENLRNAAFLRIYIENVRQYFGPGEVQEIWITFPDPHYKPGEAKKRLSSWRFMKEYSQILADGGLLHLKSDDQFLFEFTRACALALELEIQETSEDVLKTHASDPVLSIRTTYETRWISEGKSIYYIRIKMDKNAFSPERYEKAQLRMKEWQSVHNPPRPA